MVCQHVQLAGKGNPHDQFSAAVGEILEVNRFLGEVAVDPLHPHGGRRINEQSIDQVHEVVAGGAAYCPSVRQPLGADQDFFNQHVMIGTACLSAVCLAKGGRYAVLQALEILHGIVQAVWVVDAQAIDFSLRDQRENQMMRRLKNGSILHANGRKVVGVEETAVVDVVGGHAPVCQPVGLHLDQLVKLFETWRVRRVAIDDLDRLLNAIG